MYKLGTLNELDRRGKTLSSATEKQRAKTQRTVNQPGVKGKSTATLGFRRELGRLRRFKAYQKGGIKAYEEERDKPTTPRREKWSRGSASQQKTQYRAKPEGKPVKSGRALYPGGEEELKKETPAKKRELTHKHMAAKAQGATGSKKGVMKKVLKHRETAKQIFYRRRKPKGPMRPGD